MVPQKEPNYMITEEAQAVLQDLDDHKFAKVKEAVRDMHYADVAELFESIEDQETAVQARA